MTNLPYLRTLAQAIFDRAGKGYRVTALVDGLKVARGNLEGQVRLSRCRGERERESAVREWCSECITQQWRAEGLLPKKAPWEHGNWQKLHEIVHRTMAN